jgi:dihydrodipicolinate synthase/N-acetylneuraminate lyase
MFRSSFWLRELQRALGKEKKARMAIRKVPFLKGAFTPLVVPFKSGAIDYDRYAELIEWQIEQGTHGLLVNATSGEPTTLSLDEKAQLIEVAVNRSARRMPVIAGIAAESHADAVTLLGRAEKVGADAILSVTPSGNFIKVPNNYPGFMSSQLKSLVKLDAPAKG